MTIRVSTAVREQRERMGLTIEEVCARSGVPVSHWRMLEDGWVPGQRVTRKISVAIGWPESGIEQVFFDGFDPADFLTCPVEP